MFLIEKSDFPAYVMLSDNIEDRMILPYIRDAEVTDFSQSVPADLITDMKAALEAYKGEWNGSNAYVVSDIVSVDGAYYKAASDNTGDTPPSSNWAACELMQFYADNVKPYLVYAAYYRFIAYHGINITQYGVRQMVEDTSEEISSGRRSEMLGDISSKMSIFAGKINKAFKDAAYTFDSVIYTVASKQRVHNSPKLFAVGARNNYKNYNPYD